MRSCIAVLGFALACSCTFYTNCPNGGGPAQQCEADIDRAGTGGTNAGGDGAGGDDEGGSGTSGGGSTGMAIIEDVIVEGTWSDATGSLRGTPTGFGNVSYVTALGDQRLIAGLSGVGLWASDDAGESWQKLGAGSPDRQIDNRTGVIVADPVDGDSFWEAGSYGAGVFWTQDGGESFAQLGTLRDTEGLAVDLSDPERATLFASVHEATGNLYRSTNGGDDWEDIGRPEGTNGCSYPLVLDRQTVFTTCSHWGGASSGIFRSGDTGASWEKVGSQSAWETPLVASDGAIYWSVEGGGGLIVTTDGGSTWTTRVNGFMRLVHPIELPDGRIATIANQAVVVSSNQGKNWRPVTPEAPFEPVGLTYSPAHRAFFVWRLSTEEAIPAGVILSFGFDATN